MMNVMRSRQKPIPALASLCVQSLDSLPPCIAKSHGLALPHKVPTSASPLVPMKAIPMKSSRSSSRNHGRASAHASSNALVHPALMPACTLLDCWYPLCSRMLSPRLPFVSQSPTTMMLMPPSLVVHLPPLLPVRSTSPSSQEPSRSHTLSP